MGQTRDRSPRELAVTIARSLHEAARQVGAETSTEEIAPFIEDLLLGERQLWACFTTGVITADETATALVQRTVTWLAHGHGFDGLRDNVWAAFNPAIAVVSARLSEAAE